MTSKLLRSGIAALCLLSGLALYGQGPLITKDGTTTFFSEAPLENIEAINRRTSAAMDLEAGQIVVKMLIEHFEFENRLMQEHFNENYMESEKFPSALFEGSFPGAGSIHWDQPATHRVQVEGELTMHGVRQTIRCPAELRIGEDGQIVAKTTFRVRPEDYGIEIPSIVVQNIAEEVDVETTLSFTISQSSQP